MAKKAEKTTKKRKNQVDATLRNVRAGRTRDSKLEARLKDLEARVARLESFGVL